MVVVIQFKTWRAFLTCAMAGGRELLIKLF
ncbi:Uncharacterised protein [Vibrio cholerae]|nr:Uncharacterised protein [Vibrio cholerae]CSI55617.1 Uncharacterised protein [Vibrio cholerae]